MEKKWHIYKQEPQKSIELAQRLGISPLVAQLLINRGIAEAEEVRGFLYGDLSELGDPLAFADMETAVNRIEKAIASGENILVFGDYDVDGITSTALLVRVLRRLGAKASFHIPERISEGYGLNRRALQQQAESGVTLVITVDCGISGFDEVTFAREMGMEIIITDHHTPLDHLPSAVAVINPKRADCPSKCEMLAGVGVAFKLGQALASRRGWPPVNGALLGEYLDLVALGTVADIVPLIGENRLLTKFGLQVMSSTENIGLAELLEATGASRGNVTVTQVGFIVAPRLNAAGRLGDAELDANTAVELLLTEDKTVAQEIIAKLEEKNTSRQSKARDILAEADDLITRFYADDKVLVLAKEGWNPGIIGIVASKLVDKWYRPVVMISISGDIGKGSCRSIKNFDIHSALGSCAQLLTRYGGHKYAAGLTLSKENIEPLRRELNKIAGALLQDDDFIPQLDIDTLVALQEVNSGLVQQLAALEPYGMHNPSPVLACKGLAVDEMRPVGNEGRHLKLRVSQAHSTKDVIAWDMGERQDVLNKWKYCDLAFVPEINNFRGQESIQLVARDFSQRSDDWMQFGDCQRGQPLLMELPDFDFSRLRMDGERADSVNFVDGRGIRDKLIYIKQVAANDRIVLVVVNNPATALRLAGYLRCTSPALDDRIIYLSSFSSKQSVDALSFEHGRGGAIIVATDCGLKLLNFGISDTVLFDMPFTRLSMLRRSMQPVCARIHLIFGFEDAKRNSALFSRLELNRSDVVAVFTVVRKLTKRETTPTTSRKLIMAELGATGSISLDKAALCLSVLEEVGVIKFDADSDAVILTEPEHKTDLEFSSVYKLWHYGLQDFKEFSSELTTLNIADIKHKLVKYAQDISKGGD